MSKENVPKTTTMTNKKIDETPNYELEDFIIKKQQDRSFSFVTKRPIRISNASTLILDSPMNSDVQTSMSSTASSLSTPEQQQQQQSSLRKGSEFWSSPERFDDDLGYQPLKGMLSTLLLSSSKSKTRSRSIPQQQQQQQQKSQQPLSPTIMHQDDNQSRLPTHRMRISEAPTLILSDFSNNSDSSSDSSPSLSPPSQSQSKQQPSPSNSEPLLTIKYQRKIWHPSMEFESTSVSSLPLGDDEKINGKIPQPSKQDDNLRKSSPSTSKQQQQQLDDINSKKTEKISIKIQIYEHDRLLREKMLKNDAEFDSTRQREEDEMMKLQQQKSSTSSTSSSSESEFLGKSSNPITSVDGSLRHKSFAPNRRVKSNDELKTAAAISTETLKSKNRKKSKKRTNQPKRSLIFKSLQDIDQLDDDYDPEHGLRQLASFETDSETAERKNELLKHLASYEQQHSFTGGGRRRRIDRISSSEEYENEMRANLLPTIRPTTTVKTKTPPPLPSPTITDMEKLEKIINEFNLQFKLSKVRNLSVKNEPKMIQVEKHDKNWFRKQQMDDFKKSCSSGSGILRSDSGSGIRRSDSSSGSSRKRLSVPKIRSPTDRRHKSIGKSVDQQQQQQRRRRSPPISLPPPMSPLSASTSASSASTSLPPRPSSSKSKSKSKLPQPKQVPSSSESESESDSSSSSSISITPRTSESESASISPSTSSLSSGSSSAAGSPLPPLKAPSASSLDRQKSTGKIPKQISKQQQQTKRKRRKKYHGPLMRRLSIPNRQLRRFIHKMFHTIINHNENNNIIINQPKMMITRDAIEILNSMAKELIRKYAEYADQLILYSGRRKMDRWVSFSTIKMFLSPTLNHTTKESIIQIINDYGYYQDLNDRSEIKHKSQITEQQSQSQSQSQQPGPSTSSLASSSTSKSNIPSSKQQP